MSNKLFEDMSISTIISDTNYTYYICIKYFFYIIDNFKIFD